MPDVNGWKAPINPLLRAAYDRAHEALGMQLLGILAFRKLALAHIYLIQWLVNRYEISMEFPPPEEAYPEDGEGTHHFTLPPLP